MCKCYSVYQENDRDDDEPSAELYETYDEALADYKRAVCDATELEGVMWARVDLITIHACYNDLINRVDMCLIHPDEPQYGWDDIEYEVVKHTDYTDMYYERFAPAE